MRSLLVNNEQKSAASLCASATCASWSGLLHNPSLPNSHCWVGQRMPMLRRASLVNRRQPDRVRGAGDAAGEEPAERGQGVRVHRAAARPGGGRPARCGACAGDAHRCRPSLHILLVGLASAISTAIYFCSAVNSGQQHRALGSICAGAELTSMTMRDRGCLDKAVSCMPHQSRSGAASFDPEGAGVAHATGAWGTTAHGV